MKKLRILVACEYSGRVRDAFTRYGHYALSCDLLPSDAPGNHYQGDIKDVILSHHGCENKFDLMIAHPPCTDLAVSGARHFPAKIADGRQQAALDFVRYLMSIDDRIAYAIENPISVISSKIRKPDQIIQPWMFGHGETKSTCLWLRGLPKLIPTDIVEGRDDRIHKMPPSPDRWKLRSTTYQGIADAMADQWSKYLLEKIN